MFNSSRRNMRFPAQVETAEILSKTTARVLDESLSGISLEVDGPVSLTIGDQVDIDYSGAAMPAIVRRLSKQDDGATLIGFQWK
jgi:hypothetical protein